MDTYVGLKVINMGFNAHLTLQYFGNVDMATEDKYWSLIGTLQKTSYKVQRESIHMFGPNKDIPVVTVVPGNDLIAIQKTVSLLIPSASEFPWNPHITLNLDHSEDIVLPRDIYLGELDCY